MPYVNTPADLDVRTEEEFVGGHAPKAINVPVKLKTDVGAYTGPSLSVNLSRLLGVRD
jgi:3-mercaptopyruvate sulfurtransferase SseA